MDLARLFYQLLYSILLIVSIAQIARLEATEKEISNTDTASAFKKSDENGPKAFRVQSYSVPFLILMSNDEICVAQLPLIDNGSVSIAYRLSNKQSADEEKPPRKEDDSQAAIGENADAREYEQMPPSSVSLGKSEWQQIAANRKFSSKRDREEEVIGSVTASSIALNSAATVSTTLETTPAATTITTQKEGSKDAADDSAKEDTRFPRRRRRSKRSNNLDDGIDASVHSNNSSTNALPESGPQNVTSAASSSSSLSGSFSSKGSAEDDEAAREEGTNSAAAQEEDDKNSPVHFSDFDVHMALGYAFVADSRGRIHRFKLNGPEKAGEHLNLGKGLLPTTEQEYVDADYTNTIDGAAQSSSSTRSGNSQPAKHQLSSNWLEAHGTKNGRAENAGRESEAFAYAAGSNHDYEANKVGRASVTHEQSGRHPAVSGRGNDDDDGGGDDDDNGGDAAAPDGQPSGRATSGVNFATNRADKQQARLNAARDAGLPKIIWSRLKPSLSNTAMPRQKAFTSGAIKGALPVQNSADNAQMAGERGKQMESAVEGDEQQLSGTLGQSGSGGRAFGHEANHDNNSKQDESEQTSGSVDFTGGNQQEASAARRAKSLGARSLQTEIAVDWLNNLLFVLDKYRLLVVDFDGNNELVLIDDFNANNRPIDIKVDPVNDFLFWLQEGKFHNTIYKLDLNVLSMPMATERMISNTMKLNQANNGVLLSGNQNDGSMSELVALISHHYAHPIITNLPQHAKLFIIDHKHSRIYVPLAPSSNSGGAELSNNGSERNRTQRDDSVEVFATASSSPDESNIITHMNSTLNQLVDSSVGPYDGYDKNCNNTLELARSGGQILAYNLDGTDVGPLRDVNNRDHLANLDDMQDITLDGDKGYLYWLTNGGRELFEEYKTGRDTTFYSAQHNLDGKEYFKLMHFDNGTNQPMHSKPRFNLRKLIHMLASSSSSRWTRSETRNQFEEAERMMGVDGRLRHSSDSDATRFTRNAPYIILAIFCVVLLSVYLIYSFIFQSSSRRSSCVTTSSREGSIVGSSISGTNGDCDANGVGLQGTISRWIGKASTRSADTSTSKRDSNSNERVDPYDTESTNYNTSNAIDEHYRDIMNDHHQRLFDLSTKCLANLNEWPSNLMDLSNKLYVPVEVLQDDALASIRRVTIDQLDIERRSPLGEGHFGTVLQGTITCTLDERTSMLNKLQQSSATVSCDQQKSPLLQDRRVQIPSSTSSGHGSSSTSSEFITAPSCVEPDTGDYLTPNSQGNSTMSDYAVEGRATSSRPDSDGSYHNSTLSAIKNRDGYLIQEHDPMAAGLTTKLRVAIKKLKDNASVDEKRDFLKEAKLLANFDHPNIVHLIGICLDRGSTLIIMELMLGGDLIRYMQENTRNYNRQDNLTDEDLFDICLDIVNGCCYLERLKYIHRDLAARNCLVSSQKKEERVVKLADFGLARDIYKDSYYKKLNDSAMPLKWMAPECLTEKKFSTMSDVWSFGVVMWEVMSYCRDKPYESVDPCFMERFLTGGGRLPKPENCGDDIYRLMNECWQLEPRNRPTFQEARAILIEIKNGRRH